MITKTLGCALIGIEANLIDIEVTIVHGTQFFMVGLPDKAVQESQQRIESVLKHLNYQMPRQKVIVNLAPASLRKEGTAYDLPIALAILHASKQLVLKELGNYLIMGELALDGRLRPIQGALSMALIAGKSGCKAFLLPKENAQEAAIANSLPIIGVVHISEAIAYCAGKRLPLSSAIMLPNLRDKQKIVTPTYAQDYKEVKGQALAKRACQIAAAGGHNLLMIGPPGAGKTMLAHRIATILPPLTLQEALETTQIYSIVRAQQKVYSVRRKRPFRSPHHTISEVALIGGGSIPKPGEVSLAHHGILFLDELPEFRRSALEVLRQPLEERRVHLARAQLSCTFPASFMLVASMNPCPCGYYTHPIKDCSCTPFHRNRYLKKISGPLLDRMDIQLSLSPLDLSLFSTSFTDNKEGECMDSQQMRKVVTTARERQKERFNNYPTIYTNAMIPTQLLDTWCTLRKTTQHRFHQLIERFSLSARAYNRIRSMARTIADMEESEDVQIAHIEEALCLRSLDGLEAGISYKKTSVKFSFLAE